MPCEKYKVLWPVSLISLGRSSFCPGPVRPLFLKISELKDRSTCGSEQFCPIGPGGPRAQVLHVIAAQPGKRWGKRSSVKPDPYRMGWRNGAVPLAIFHYQVGDQWDQGSQSKVKKFHSTGMGCVDGNLSLDLNPGKVPLQAQVKRRHGTFRHLRFSRHPEKEKAPSI